MTTALPSRAAEFDFPRFDSQSRMRYLPGLLGAMAIRGAEVRGNAPGDTLLHGLPQLPLPDFLERFFGR